MYIYKLLQLFASSYQMRQVKVIPQSKKPIQFAHFWFLEQHLNSR